MNIGELVPQYVAFRRSLGERFRQQEYRLQAFCRAVGAQTPITDIKVQAVAVFLAGDGPVTSAWFKKHEALMGFFRFAISRGHLTANPLPPILPQRPPRSTPYIYTRDELRQLLDAIPPCQEQSRTIIQPTTLRAILLLLYGAGLRANEALSLSTADVDLRNNLLTIRGTKFFKSRLVPIGQHLTSVLTEYTCDRTASSPVFDRDGPFFLGKHGKAITKQTLECTFTRLREYAGIRRCDDAHFQPRLHDLRHTFAVHRLVSWYRHGDNVQRLLYFLCIYLGHTELSATQVYLTMTPELLQQANSRFEQYALGEDNHA